MEVFLFLLIGVYMLLTEYRLRTLRHELKETNAYVDYVRELKAPQ